MATSVWPEIATAREEKRHELVLHGPDISQRIDKSGLDEAIFRLEHLNLLEVYKTTLKEVPKDIHKLSNLTSLVLHSNSLISLPDEMGKLQKLKLLDLSFNQLSTIPEMFGKLNHVETLNLSSNQLTSLPAVFSGMENLHILDVSYNKLTELPSDITSSSLEHFQKLAAQENQIEAIPDGINELPSLKHLNMSNNALKEIPPILSECMKLKELILTGNKLKDRRLQKMVEGCTTKAVMEYLAKERKKEVEKEGKGGGGGGKSKKNRKKGKAAQNDDEEDEMNTFEILHFQEASSVVIKSTEIVGDVRPHVVCCVVKGLDFNKSQNMYKRFITLQTKLHEDVCAKRQSATIATHDLSSLKLPLTYDARNPNEVYLVQLFKTKSTRAGHLVLKLREEAEAERKAKKRHTYSGIYKYLNLLDGFDKFPFLFDAEDEVISFPPITNCEKTKITRDTTDLLLEVTSTVSLEMCKKVMEALLVGILELGCSNSGSEESEETSSSKNTLIIEQGKVVNSSNGSLKVVYPSRADLTGEQYKVKRDYE